MGIFFAVLIVILSMGAPAEAKTEKIHSFRSGGWQGAAYENRATGRFSHCMITAKYTTGRRIIFVATSAWDMSLLVRDPGWNVGSGKKYSVGLFVDQTNLGERTATSIENDTVSINFGQDTGVVEKLRHGRVLELIAAKRTFRFKLTGTARALTRIRQCVATANALAPRDAAPERRGAVNPFAAERRPSRVKAPMPRTAGRGEDATPLLRRLLRAAGVRDPRFFDPRAKWNLPRGTYGWIDDGVIGLHFAVDRESRPVRVPVTDALAMVGKKCDGKFATAVKPTTFSGAYGITEGVGQCGGGSDATAVHISALSLKQSVFMFVHVGFGDGTFTAQTKATRFKEVLVDLIADRP